MPPGSSPGLDPLSQSSPAVISPGKFPRKFLEVFGGCLLNGLCQAFDRFAPGNCGHGLSSLLGFGCRPTPYVTLLVGFFLLELHRPIKERAGDCRVNATGECPHLQNFGNVCLPALICCPQTNNQQDGSPLRQSLNNRDTCLQQPHPFQMLPVPPPIIAPQGHRGGSISAPDLFRELVCQEYRVFHDAVRRPAGQAEAPLETPLARFWQVSSPDVLPRCPCRHVSTNSTSMARSLAF